MISCSRVKFFFFAVTFAMANCQYRLSSSKFLELNSHEPWRGVAVKSSALANAARNKFFFDLHGREYACQCSKGHYIFQLPAQQYVKGNSNHGERGDRL